MTFDEVYETLPAAGWLTRPEAELLWRTAPACAGPILEVGSYQGRSTCLLALLGRPVYAVDPFDGFCAELSGDEVYGRLVSNLAHRCLDNVTVFRQRVEDWTPRPCGFAYLDGDHTYEGTENQIAAALRCGAKVIAVHDVNDSGEGQRIKDAALHWLGSWRERVERLAVWEVES